MEICRLTGASYRQIDYWVRLGILRTAFYVEGSGRARRFERRELRVAVIVRALYATGIGQGQARAEGSHIVQTTAQAIREHPDAEYLSVSVPPYQVEVAPRSIKVSIPLPSLELPRPVALNARRRGRLS
jgi:hypothetical protein